MSRRKVKVFDLSGLTWAGPTVYRHDVGGEVICTCNSEESARALCAAIAILHAERDALRDRVEAHAAAFSAELEESKNASRRQAGGAP